VERLKGKAPATIDSKGRVSLPAKYRKLLPEDLVVTKSPDDEYPSLTIYTPEGFESWITQVFESKGGYRANDRAHDRIIEKYYANAEDVKVDGVGRILIPAELREYAHIEKDIMFSAMKDHLIIRDAAIWEAYEKALEPVTPYDDHLA